MGRLLVRHDPRSVGEVRHRIAAEIDDGRFTRESIDDVLLVASELVSNAVVHATGGDLVVGWQVEADAITLRVTDLSDTHPRLLTPAADASGGRGMAIVAAIARDWGVRPQPRGKQVWASIPVTRTA